MANQEVDLDAFRAALNTERGARGLSWRDVGDATGISPSTFSRLADGKGLDLHAYATCCRWMGVSLDVFADAAESVTSSLATELMILLRRHDVSRVYWASLLDLITWLPKEHPPDTAGPPTRVELGAPPA